MRVAEQGDRALVVQSALVRPGDELVEHGERVAHRAATGAHHQRQHAGADRDAFLLAQLLEVRQQRVRRDQAERVVVGARADGADHLVRLGGREDELHVRRRLLDDLEQRVEPLRGHHVRLVEDEHLVPVARGREGRSLAQVTRVVHAVVAGRVDLDHVEAARAAAAQLDARVARAAGLRRGPLGTVQAAGQDAGGRRLATAARAGEQVGMGDPVRPQGLGQRLGDVLLTDHLGERLGPVAAVQGLAHAATLDADADARNRRSPGCAPAGVTQRRPPAPRPPAPPPAWRPARARRRTSGAASRPRHPTPASRRRRSGTAPGGSDPRRA